MPERSTETYCLIIADSDVLVRSSLADYLRDCGYKVIEAASSDEVVAVLQDTTLQIDTLLMDADLAGSLNAFALRLWVKQNNSDVDVVLAGNTRAAAEAAGELCDEGPELQRPYDPQSVIDYIKRLRARLTD